MRRPIVGVMGSGQEAHEHLARPLGQWLASLGVHLLTGGGQGVMAAVSRAFCESPGRSGLAIGVIPPRDEDDATLPRPGYPNDWVEVAIHTHLPHSGERGWEVTSRNHINVLSSTVVVALPGGAGTGTEVALAQRYGRPVMAFLDETNGIVGLPLTVPVVTEFVKVQEFVQRYLRTVKR